MLLIEPGHDKRYAIDSTKLKDELGWEPTLQFEEGIEKTVIWYLNNKEWLNNIISRDYLTYYDKHIKFDDSVLSEYCIINLNFYKFAKNNIMYNKFLFCIISLVFVMSCASKKDVLLFSRHRSNR